MRIFVTGWDGLLGSALVPLLKQEHEVAGVGLGAGDICARDVLRPRLEAFRPEMLVHLAAMTAVDDCESRESEAFRVNAEGSRTAAAEAERIDAGILALSTDYVFDGRGDVPCRESDPPRPLGVYGKSKLAGEEAVREASTRWTIVRSAWLFGAGGPNFVDTILKLLETRDTVQVVSDQVGSPTYAPDLAGSLARLLGAGARGLYHVANAGRASWFDLAVETVRVAGLDPARIRPASTETVGRPAPRPRFSVLDTGRVRSEHGVVLRPWTEALETYLKSRSAA